MYRKAASLTLALTLLAACGAPGGDSTSSVGASGSASGSVASSSSPRASSSGSSSPSASTSGSSSSSPSTSASGSNSPRASSSASSSPSASASSSSSPRASSSASPSVSSSASPSASASSNASASVAAAIQNAFGPQGQLALQAVTQLAAQTGVPITSLSLQSTDQVEWPNSGLGCEAPGQSYTQAIVPGYKVVVSDGTRTYNIHASQQGNVIWCDNGTPTPLTGN